MSKFTKGTWEFDTELCFVKNKKGDEIAELFWDTDDGDKEERLQANGRLIAAAPEMYELLRDLAKELRAYGDEVIEDLYGLMVAAEELTARIDGQDGNV